MPCTRTQLLVLYPSLEHKAGPGRETNAEGLALVNSLLRGDLAVQDSNPVYTASYTFFFSKNFVQKSNLIYLNNT